MQETLRTIILFWFGLSVLILLFSNLAFFIWLRRYGVKLEFLLTGTPGYLEYTYYKWCRAQGRSPTVILILRLVLIVNVVAAAVALMSILSSS